MERVEKIFVINLAHRSDRLESIKKELENIGFIDKMEIVPGVIIEGRPEAGIASAHSACIELSKKRGYEIVMILEDDCKFIVDGYTFNNELKVFFDTCPCDWNGLWVGSFWQVENIERFNYNWVVPLCFCQDTATIINNRFYDELLESYKICIEDNINMDEYVSSKIPIYVLKTRLCCQADGYSDRTGEYMNGGNGIQL
jgi:GR25 family glycosyltransferase involved in LPS biosynthesis